MPGRAAGHARGAAGGAPARDSCRRKTSAAPSPPRSSSTRRTTRTRGVGSASTCSPGAWTGSHPWRAKLLAAGVPEAELEDFLSGDLAPMTLGFNYYATSERFLDHRLAPYPLSTHGGNGRHAYADTEAVRVPMPEGSIGWLPRLRDAWERYRRAARGDGGAHRLRRGRAGALARRAAGGRSRRCAPKARTFAPSPSGPCSARWIGAAC